MSARQGFMTSGTHHLLTVADVQVKGRLTYRRDHFNLSVASIKLSPGTPFTHYRSLGRKSSSYELSRYARIHPTPSQSFTFQLLSNLRSIRGGDTRVLVVGGVSEA
ncbi:hypothetical protein PoB_002844300 [Plakobranchus ocellatus]|uniref:Uncharacterized protein n=1 Tax=Plakobranchus ocellatus TaxID=259542 RepID=A0AAV4A5E8_9GAST|nr:hypothetical protein PoB_002844300 [Plakobranchus ocellatus]